MQHSVFLAPQVFRVFFNSPMCDKGLIHSCSIFILGNVKYVCENVISEVCAFKNKPQVTNGKYFVHCGSYSRMAKPLIV